MAELKTQPTKQNPSEYLQSITPESKQADAKIIYELCKKVTKQKPILWGDAIIGFGEYSYRRKNESVDRKWMKTGFSARKAYLVLYILSGLEDEQDLLDKLGKYKTGSSCLYIKKVSDINLAVLEQLITKGYQKKSFSGQC